jgi:(p)ppGpp synthase/HD superfamily hydrolase
VNFKAETYFRALEFAARAHADQKTPTGLPYIVHPSCVVMELIRALREEQGLDEDFAVTCALLHDVLEDTQTPAAELGREFGPQVLAAVQALTKNANLPKEERMEDSLKRILQQPREVAMVKLADRIANLAPPPAIWTAWKIREYRKEAQRILEALRGASAFLAQRFEERLATYGMDRPGAFAEGAAAAAAHPSPPAGEGRTEAEDEKKGTG